MYVILGVDTASFYDTTVMKNFGLAFPFAIDSDGDMVFTYTSQGQLWQLQPGQAQNEIGFAIGNKLAPALGGTFNPASSYVSVHRNGTDSALFISNGQSSLAHYNANLESWSTLYSLAGNGGIKCIRSIETSAGVWSFMAGRNNNSGYLLTRNLGVFGDDGNQAYAAFATIGTIRFSNPGEPLFSLGGIAFERTPVGTEIGLSILLNDVSGSFTTLPTTAYVPEPSTWSAPVGEPGAPSTGVIAWRADANTAQQQLPTVIRHMQVKVTFPSTDTVKNEIIGLCIFPETTDVG
jgi:hypothetical protein